MPRRDRDAPIVIARMDAERHFYYRGGFTCVVQKRGTRVEKGRTDESGESRCEPWKIRNAAVAIANHSEATARIAISCGFCRTLSNP